MRRLHIFLLVILGSLSVLGGSAVAEGQNSLESSNPAAGETITLAPTQIQLRFAQPVGGDAAVAQMGLVLTCESTITNLGPPQLAADGVTVSAALTQIPDNGTCVVTWELPDGSSGTYSFEAATQPTTVPPDPNDTVPGPTIPGLPGSEVDDTPLRLGGPIGLMRWLVYIGVSMLFGGLIFIKFIWPEGVEYGITERWFRLVSIATAGAIVVQIALVAARDSDATVFTGFSPTSWGVLLDSNEGRALLVRLIVVIGLGYFSWITERVLEPTNVALSSVLIALSVMSYGFDRSSGRQLVIGIIVTMIHVAATSYWVGSTALVWRVVLFGPGENDLVVALRGWRRFTVPVTIVVVTTGAVLTWRLDGLSLVNSGHGRVVLLKAALVALMIFVSLAIRDWVNRALARASALNERAVARLKRPAAVELSLGVVVLAASSWLMAMRPPYILPPDTGPRIEYAIVNDMVGDDDFRVRLSITPGNTGPNQVLVELFGPARVQNFTIAFTPANPDFPGYTLFVPLTRPGAALVGPEAGLTLNAPGEWTAKVTAVSTVGELPELTSTFVIADGVTVTTVPKPGVTTPTTTTVAGAGATTTSTPPVDTTATTAPPG